MIWSNATHDQWNKMTPASSFMAKRTRAFTSVERIEKIRPVTSRYLPRIRMPFLRRERTLPILACAKKFCGHLQSKDYVE